MSEFNPKLTYLTAPRDHVLGDVLSSDWQKLTELRETEENVSPLDFFTSVQGSLDLALGTSLSLWASGKVLPKEIRKFHDEKKDQMELNYQTALHENLEFIKGCGLDATTRLVSQVGSLTQKSELNPSWRPLVLETWIRRGPTFASLPVIFELLGRKHQPVRSVPGKIGEETLTRLVCASEALRKVQETILNPHEYGITKGGRHYIRSLDGLLAEYDGLLTLHENIIPPDGTNVWHLPASPNMDFGKQTKQKCDLTTVIFNNSKPSKNGVVAYDVKLNPGKYNEKNGVRILSAMQIGCEVIRDNGVERKIGLNCDEFIKSQVEAFNDFRLVTDEIRFAIGMAVVGESLPVMHSLLHDFSGETECSLPAKYRISN